MKISRTKIESIMAENQMTLSQLSTALRLKLPVSL